MSGEPVLFLGFLALGITVVAFFAYLERRRGQALRAGCARRGWSYRAEDRSLVARWELGPFEAGNSWSRSGQRARHIVSGEFEGRPFVAFEYSYTEGSGKNRTTHTYSVCALDLPVPLPSLSIEPEGWLSRVADAVGLTDEVDVESAEFNEAFSVRATNRKFAYDVLHPRHLELLLRSPRTGWWIEGATIVAAPERSLDLDEVMGALTHLTQVVAQVPTFVWLDRGYDPGAIGTDPTTDPRSTA